MPSRGKKYTEQRKKIDRDTMYPLEDGLALAKGAAFAEFDESFDVAVRLGVNPKYSDQMIRGSVVLPNGSGKTIRVLVFAKGEKAAEAEAAGADFVGAEELIEKIQGGFLDFDKAIATPDMMPKVGKIGRILGSRGLMPNPKVGTVTMDVATAVRESKAGKIEFRVDKAGIVHSTLGRKSFGVDQIQGNFMALLETLIKLKPSSVKGAYVRGIGVSTTMGPGVRLDVNDVLEKIR